MIISLWGSVSGYKDKTLNPALTTVVQATPGSIAPQLNCTVVSLDLLQ